MKSIIVCIRLTEEELSWLDKYSQNQCGGSRSCYLRYLLHHEHDKRTKNKNPDQPSDIWHTDWRKGRPKD